jgi:hypothetical protein
VFQETRLLQRLSENTHLPFDMLKALSETEGLRYPHPSSLRRTSMYASFLRIRPAEDSGMDIFHQPLRSRFFDSLAIIRHAPGSIPTSWNVAISL